VNDFFTVLLIMAFSFLVVPMWVNLVFRMGAMGYWSGKFIALKRLNKKEK